MKSSFEFLLNLTPKVMNSDEQFSNNVDKKVLNQQVNEHVRLISYSRNLKPQR